ncbi:MAG: hypothetical protein A2784_01670 [Candidatus Chisholmbacteria bacterium RIFCSPHIGHO2_01_FULL_48_12]|uniref:DUF3048 domain-containing protein n=1 Tax=Candidatus Chisholmbacteria bacterium RIFCSPHIGHO2_01_FULL_48_12 TaxID=1797589 RepID=A0A1G1VR61_9BACT|nr:MAG: hypothetical protein A2784_01670 [Candidatus Chisholmbacteria bacterium RIFCSPHIGHO2_01_FULL_48_12]
MKQLWLMLIGGVGLYVLSTGVSLAAFRFLNTRPQGFTSPLPSEGGFGLMIDPGEAKDQQCPINGSMLTKTEKKAWEEKRPVVAMVENHPDARPQSGLSTADVMYEAVAEGGITRFMGVFYCGAQATLGKIAPVRSARMYFVNLATEYNTPVYVHVGGGNCGRDQTTGECVSNKKAWALEELADLGWRRRGGNDFDTIGDIGAPILKRDETRLGPGKGLAVEHTMVGFLDKIWAEAAKRSFGSKNEKGVKWLDGFKQWKFQKDAEEDKRGDVAKISFDFWDEYEDFTVTWEYDKPTNRYKRLTGGQPHTDLENNQQLVASAIVVQLVKEEGPLDSPKHMYYEVMGKGKAVIFQNGQAIQGGWEKKDQMARTVFTDEKGKELALVGGPIFIELVPARQQVTY